MKNLIVKIPTASYYSIVNFFGAHNEYDAYSISALVSISVASLLKETDLRAIPRIKHHLLNRNSISLRIDSEAYEEIQLATGVSDHEMPSLVEGAIVYLSTLPYYERENILKSKNQLSSVPTN